MRFLWFVGLIAIIKRKLTLFLGVLITSYLLISFRQVRPYSPPKKICKAHIRCATSVEEIVTLLNARSLSPLVTGSERGSGVSDELINQSEILVAELRIVQSMDADGDIHVYDVSQSSDGSDLEPSKALELIEWARASVLAPMVYGMMQAFDDSEEEEY